MAFPFKIIFVIFFLAKVVLSDTTYQDKTVNCDEYASLKQEIQQLKERVKHLENNAVSTKPNHDTLSSHNGNFSRRLLDNGVSRPLAFHAAIGHVLSNLADNQVIIFPDVKTNIGNVYNPSNGIFRCPIAGLYFFSVTVVVMPHRFVELQLVKNGVRFGTIYARSDGDPFDSATNTFIADLDVGDDIWVKVNGGYHSTGDVIDPGFSTFSGFMIH